MLVMLAVLAGHRQQEKSLPMAGERQANEPHDDADGLGSHKHAMCELLINSIPLDFS